MTDLNGLDKESIAHELGYASWDAVPEPVQNNVTAGSDGRVYDGFGSILSAKLGDDA